MKGEANPLLFKQGSALPLIFLRECRVEISAHLRVNPSFFHQTLGTMMTDKKKLFAYIAAGILAIAIVALGA